MPLTLKMLINFTQNHLDDRCHINNKSNGDCIIRPNRNRIRHKNTHYLRSTRPLSSSTYVYLFVYIVVGLCTTLAIVLNGADCLTDTSSSTAGGVASSNADRVFVIKTPASTQHQHGANKKSAKETFKEHFDKLTIQVKENTPIGTKLADIQAENNGSPTGKIMYAIIGGQDMSKFLLRVDNDVNKVELVNDVAFDYESEQKVYHVVIRGLSLYFRYEVDVDIIVTDENDNKPQLDDFSIVFNNYKNHFPTAPIGRVPATDLDRSDQLRYKVLAGNNAQLVVVNETTGDIQLSSWLNSNVPMKAIIMVEVNDGFNEDVASLVLTVNLITETMLQNSVVLRLEGIGRDEFLTKKYDTFLNTMARILGVNNNYGINNLVVFNVEESRTVQHSSQQVQDPALHYRLYNGSSIVNTSLCVNVSFSARTGGNDVEQYFSSQYIEERIHSNRMFLSQALEVDVAPFQDNLCVHEPCQNYQECQAMYKFDKDPPDAFITRGNMIFRPVKATQDFTCRCPQTFTGMERKEECNLQINQCFSNPCLNGGTCHRHESGYTCECKNGFIGARCQHSFANSTCQSIASPHLDSENEIPSIGLSTSLGKLMTTTSMSTTICAGKSHCVNLNRAHPTSVGRGNINPLAASTGGFTCQNCPYPQWSNDLCQLRARSFNKNSYITLPSLRRRHRFHISLQFATMQSNALLFYNGRYNDKHDFIALELIDSHLKFSFSLGSSVTSVSLYSIPVSNGHWHKVAIDYKDRNVILIVDDCDPVIDEALSKIQGSSFKRCSNSTSADTNGNKYRMLDLTSPMQIGALTSIPMQAELLNINGFVGCINDLHIDHQLVDLSSPIQESGTQVGCPEKRDFCKHQSCNGFPCQDLWGEAKCLCGEDRLGKSCEIVLTNERIRRFMGNSYLAFNPTESTVPANWFVSLYFRTNNPNGVLFKVSLDPESSIVLELSGGDLRLSHRLNSMSVTNVNLDDGEWHFVEITWTTDHTQIQLDHNPILSSRSSDMGTIAGATMKSVTVGASITRLNDQQLQQPPSSVSSTSDIQNDFVSGVTSAPSSSDDFTSIQLYGSNSSQSFVGCIYGVNLSGNTENWLIPNDERNVERGCQVPDICESNPCPSNSRCIRSSMHQPKCICNPGFVGDRCIPVCDLFPCQGEHSRCQPVKGAVDMSLTHIDQYTTHQMKQQYTCDCEPLRSGNNCEHQLSPRCPSNWWGRPVAGSNSSICGPCNCDESRGFDGDCDKSTGQCFCKSNHYQPTGSSYCLACDCYIVGSLSTSCNQTTGQCKCRPGVVGRRCDTCASPYAEVTLRGCEVIYDACPKTFTDGIWWDKTQLDKIATQQCPPSTSTGTATRFCHKTDGWQKPNLFDCISNTFTDLYKDYQLFEDNRISMTSSLAIRIAGNLRAALNETISSPSLQLYGSDMYISFRLLHHLISHESQQVGLNLTHKQDRHYIRNIAESISYILDPAYADNWPEISKRSPNGGAEYLLKLIDIYGQVLIESQSDTFTQPFEISTKYFTLGLDTLSTDTLYDINKLSAMNSPTPSSPPYATDPFGPPPVSTSHSLLSSFSGQDIQQQQQQLLPNYNSDGSSIYLDYSSTRDGSPAVMIPKYDNYALDSAHLDNAAKAFIPLKSLRIRTLQELLPTSYYLFRSRSKREELVLPDLKMVRQQPALVVYSIYRTLGPLLPSNYDTTVQHRLGVYATSNSPIIWLTARQANGTSFLSKNIQPKITYMLKLNEPIGKTRPQCATWDFVHPSNKTQTTLSTKQVGRFTTRGCEVKGIHPNHRLRYKYDYINCSCDHLGAVVVLMDAANYEYLTGEETNTKDLVLIITLSISVITLIISLFVLSCVRGHSIKSNSNSINKNILLILIVIDSLVLYSVISRSYLNQREYQCKIIAIFLHYFSLSLFFWLLVNAIHFYRMLTEFRDINHGPMKFYHVLGYAVPAFFVSVAVGLRIEQFGNYLFCWLSIHEPIIWSMFGPIIVVAMLTLILFMLALCKSLPIKEDSNGADLIRSHMFINTVKTPLIGLYWLITVYAVNEALNDYVYLLPIVTVLKSIILFVLLCIVDKYIRYNLYVNWLRFKGEKVPFLDQENMNYSTTNQPWMYPTTMSGMQAGVSKQLYPYSSTAQVTTPGFQSSCTDIFKPDVLDFSAASTTSRSTATGTSSSAYRDYGKHRTVKQDQRLGDDDYGRSRSGRHRRRHKRSHKRHHHHRHHHHHHHHHRSHHHHSGDNQDYYEHGPSEDHYGPSSRGRRDRSHYAATSHLDAQHIDSIEHSQNDLASSHPSDNEDDVSTSPKRDHTSDTQQQQAKTKDNLAYQANLGEDEQQTVPMDLMSSEPSTSNIRPANSNQQQQREDNAETSMSQQAGI